MPDLDDLDLDQNPDGDGADGGDDAGDDAGADAAASGKPEGAKDDKRISDLTSKWQQAEARAAKAEKALAADGSGSKGSDDPERKALLEELREASLDAVYGEFADLKDYGIDRSLIEGQTRAEMRESATSLVALAKAVATKERNKVLREHGIKAEPAGSTRTPAKSYDQMSDEDFERVVAEAKAGGPGFVW